MVERKRGAAVKPEHRHDDQELGAVDELGRTESGARGIPAGGLTCVGNVCFAPDGHIVVELKGDDPVCAEMTRLLGPKLLLGVATEYRVATGSAPEARARRPKG